MLKLDVIEEWKGTMIDITKNSFDNEIIHKDATYVG